MRTGGRAGAQLDSSRLPPNLRPALLVVAIWTSLCFSVRAQGAFTLLSNYTTQAITVGQAQALCQNGEPKVPIVEATISSLHMAMESGEANCTDIVLAYAQRILQYDKATGLNSVRELNPSLEATAADLDRQLDEIRQGNGTLPPMFCVPLLVKDNFDTIGMAASNGASALLDNIARQDAQQVRVLRAAGAIVLAKTNMAEWAFSPDKSIGSAFGVVRNPYNFDRVTAGSSGGTAAGVSANLGLVGLGSDTGNSIRGPAGHCGVVGIRSSIGITSRKGIMPLDTTSDVGGPIGRTVEDTVRVFQLLVGYDPDDALTSLALQNEVPSNYTSYLQAGLQGFKLGVMRQTIDPYTADPDIMKLFEDALTDLANAGAELVQNVTISGNSLGSQSWDGRNGEWYTGDGLSGHWEDLQCDRFASDMNNYLATATTRYRTVAAIVQDGAYHPSVNKTMIDRASVSYTPDQYPPPYLQAIGYKCGCGDFFNNTCRSEFRQRLIDSMDRDDLDVLVFPTWSNPPEFVGSGTTRDGNNSPQIAPPTGSPAIVVPMGFTPAGLPTSLQILARPFQEGTAFRVAYAYEQATQHRVSPGLFPECGGVGSPPWEGLGPSATLAGATSSSG